MAVYYLKNPSKRKTHRNFAQGFLLLTLWGLPWIIVLYTIAFERFPLLVIIVLIIFIVPLAAAAILRIKRPGISQFIINNYGITYHLLGGSEITIPRDRIRRIEIDEDGDLLVKSLDSDGSIGIPKEVENYDQLKSELSSLQFIQEVNIKKRFNQFYLLGFIQILIAIGFYCLFH